MFFKYNNTLFLIILINSSILSISVSSWLIAWMSLELNLMMLIPLLINKIKFNSVNSAIKYFLSQAFASIIIIISVSIFLIFNYSSSVAMNSDLLVVSMMIKSGVPPFQFWLPQVMELVEYFQVILILSWQKISPFMFLSYNKTQILLLFLLTGAFVGSVGGLNQNSIKKLLAYSSMIHASWMISCVLISEKTWATYFVFYSLILISLVGVVSTLKVKKSSDMTKKNLSYSFKTSFCLNVLSLGGLPPFLGFLGKLMVMKNLILFDMVLFLFSLLVSSFISLLFYTRLCYMVFMKSNVAKKQVSWAIISGSFVLLMSISMNLILPCLVLLT